MTDTTTPDLTPVIPEGCDPIDDLTVAELGVVGRQLGCDPYAAVADQSHGIRWLALGHLAWVWAKRSNPRAKLDPILQLRPAEVAELLRMGGTDDDPAGDDDVQPVDVDQELTDNPTEPTPA